MTKPERSNLSLAIEYCREELAEYFAQHPNAARQAEYETSIKIACKHEGDNDMADAACLEVLMRWRDVLIR